MSRPGDTQKHRPSVHPCPGSTARSVDITAPWYPDWVMAPGWVPPCQRNRAQPQTSACGICGTQGRTLAVLSVMVSVLGRQSRFHHCCILLYHQGRGNRPIWRSSPVGPSPTSPTPATLSKRLLIHNWDTGYLSQHRS
jgi:hypothetical protein